MTEQLLLQAADRLWRQPEAATRGLRREAEVPIQRLARSDLLAERDSRAGLHAAMHAPGRAGAASCTAAAGTATR